MGYFGRVGAALSQLLNAVKGGREDETTSSAEGRYNRTQPKTGAPTLTKILDKIDPGHTEDAIEFTDYGRPQAHGLDDRPPGAAKYEPHPFRPDSEGHCDALVNGVTCKAPLWHECHEMPPCPPEFDRRAR